jgi:hypothetical protein
MVQSVHRRPRRYRGEGMLVIIDQGVVDYGFLAAGALPGAEVLVLNGDEDAIAQITAALHRTPMPFASLHIVTGGSPGVLHFSSGDFSLRTLKGYVEQLQTWFVDHSALPSVLNPKIFLYGSQVGAQDVGLEFVDTLTWLTSATVVAAVTPIGRRQWSLPGQAPEECAFTTAVQDNYKGILK